MCELTGLTAHATQSISQIGMNSGKCARSARISTQNRSKRKNADAMHNILHELPKVMQQTERISKQAKLHDDKIEIHLLRDHVMKARDYIDKR